MNRFLVFGALALIKLCGIGLIVFLAGCKPSSDTKAGTSQTSAPQSTTPALNQAPTQTPTQATTQIIAPTLRIEAEDLETVKLGEIATNVTITGSLKAQKQSLIKSKSAGEVTALALKEGDSVNAGQRVAQIDDLDAKLRLNERIAARKAAQAQAELAQRVFQNQKQLFDKGFISQAALDNFQTQLDVARANLESAVASLRVVEKSINDAILVSPISGVVAEVFVQTGEKVGSDARLLSVVDLRSIEFEAPAPADLSAAIGVGQAVSVRIDGIKDELVGRVERINPGTQAGSRSIPVHVSLNGKSSALKVGMFAEGRFVTASKTNVLVIPSSAIREAAGRRFVYVINGDNKIQERTVTLGLSDPSGLVGKRKGSTEIVQGLNANEKIVSTNLGPIRAGTVLAPAK